MPPPPYGYFEQSGQCPPPCGRSFLLEDYWLFWHVIVSPKDIHSFFYFLNSHPHPPCRKILKTPLVLHVGLSMCAGLSMTFYARNIISL